jgi:hypothetical protein
MLLCLLYSGVVYLTSRVFHGTAYELYSAVESQNRVSKRKMLNVDFLCKEVKAPLQLIAVALEKIKPFYSSEERGSVIALNMLATIHEIRILADNLLLLIRLEEGRFEQCNTSRVDFRKLFDNIVMEPLGNPAWITRVIDGNVDNIFTDQFVLNIILSDILCFAIKLSRLSSDSDGSKSICVSIEVDTVSSYLMFVVTYSSLSEQLATYSVSECITRLAIQCGGSIQYTSSGFTVRVSCLYKEDDNNLQMGSLDSNSFGYLGYGNRLSEQDSVLDESSGLTAHISVHNPEFLGSGVHFFEKVGIKCKEVKEVTDDAWGPDILILDENSCRSLMENGSLTKFKGLIVLVSDQSSYSDFSSELKGFDTILLPFPCLFSDVLQIKIYCTQLNMIPPTVNRARLRAKSIEIVPSFLARFSGSFFDSIFTSSRSQKSQSKNPLGQEFAYKHRFLMMNIFSSEVEKKFHEWRLLESCSGMKVFPPSKVVDITITAWFIFRAVLFAASRKDFYTLLDSQNLQTIAQKIIPLFFMLWVTAWREMISNYLQVHISIYWKVFFCLTLVLIFISGSGFFFDCPGFRLEDCKWNYSIPPEPISSLDQFHIGIYDGWTATNILFFNFNSNHFGW